MRHVLLLLCLLSATARAQDRPNIILVFIDDMGFSDLSCFGGRTAKTPHIDRLAAEGIAFDQFYVNSPICSPSRVAISTGQYPQRWRITSYLSNRAHNDRRGMAQWLDPRAPMLARSLRAAGYATGHFGKWHMGGQRDVGDAPLIEAYGFDRSLTNFEGLGDRVLPLKYSPGAKKPQQHGLGSGKLGRGNVTWVDRSLVTERFTSAAVAFIAESAAAKKPFYVNVWPDDVHTPMHPPLDRWEDGSKRTRYDAVLETMDAQLAPLFDVVKTHPALENNTIVLLCSDNGPEVGFGTSRPLYGHKATLFEGGVRSPLIVWAPGLMNGAAGTRNRTSVISSIDVVASLHQIAGTKPPDGVQLDGERLAGTLLGRSRAGRKAPLFFRRPPDRETFRHYRGLPDLAVRDGKWKLLCDYDGSNVRLHDLNADAGEKLDLAEGSPKVVARLRKAVLEWHKSMPADKGPDNPR